MSESGTLSPRSMPPGVSGNPHPIAADPDALGLIESLALRGKEAVLEDLSIKRYLGNLALVYPPA
jgi:hypothetical protein